MTAQPTTSAKIKFSWLIYRPTLVLLVSEIQTRRPASNDRTVHRQFQATGQPVSRTHASDAMTSRLPRYKAKCGATQVLPMRVVPFAFRYQGNRATPCQYIDTTRKAIDCASTLRLRVFSRPLQCNVLLLSWDVVCLSVVCNTRVLWPNGFMDQDATWYRGRPWPKWHCITWGPSSSHLKGHSSPPQFFRPMSIVAKQLHGSGCLVVCR